MGQDISVLLKNNTSYFIMRAHDNTGGCWWDGSRGWAFPPISHNILLLCTDGSRGALTEWHLTWERIGSEGAEFSSSTWKELQTLMPAECFWWPNSGCEHSKWCLSHCCHHCWKQATFQAAMQISASAACRFSCTAGKNAQLMVVGTLKNCFLSVNLPY